MAKILVIEDEHPVRTNIVTMLKAEGFEAIGAEDGEVGLHLAQAEFPDLIICDVMMPKLDGFGVLQQMRQSLNHKMIPFIFLTAKADKSDFRQGMVSGADDYLTKPFTRSELLEAVKAQLAKKAPIQELQQKLTELQQSNIFKEDFINTVTHELRSPLVNIIMVAEMLQKISDPNKQQHYIEILQTECAREEELINDLLDLQRLEAGIRESEDLELLDLRYWMFEIVESFQIRAQSRQQSLEIQISDIPPVLLDTSRVRRIITELLNNACKYTSPGGTISLEVCSNFDSSISTTDTTAVITFIVKNQAQIPDTALPHLFDRFYRVPGSDRWHQGGSGLGLTLVQKIVEHLQGEIQVSSEAGCTQFIVHLPTQLANF